MDMKKWLSSNEIFLTGGVERCAQQLKLMCGCFSLKHGGISPLGIKYLRPYTIKLIHKCRCVRVEPRRTISAGKTSSRDGSLFKPRSLFTFSKLPDTPAHKIWIASYHERTWKRSCNVIIKAHFELANTRDRASLRRIKWMCCRMENWLDAAPRRHPRG